MFFDKIQVFRDTSRCTGGRFSGPDIEPRKYGGDLWCQKKTLKLSSG